MTKVEKIKMMKEGKISTTLLKLGLPTMIGMIVTALYNVVDAYFVGRLGTSQIGAVSITFPISQIIIGLGMMFGSGAASYVARLLGKGDKEKADMTVSTALYTCLGVGVLAIILSMCFMNPILRALGATDSILPYAVEYSRIFIVGSIFNIFNVAMNNIVTSEGATNLTMTSMLCGAIINVILDPLLIYNAGMGISGAAIATVIAQAITSLIYLQYILRKKSIFSFSIRLFSPQKQIYAETLKIGFVIFLTQVFMSVATALTNAMAKQYGDSAIAAMGVVTRILSLGTYVVFGFSKGFQPFAGYNFGAHNFERLKKIINTTLKWMTIFSIVYAIILMAFPGVIMNLFTENDAEIVKIGVKSLRLNGLIFIFYGYELVYAALYQALGFGKEAFILGIGRQGLFFIPFVFILPLGFGLDGLIAVQPAADIVSIIVTFLFGIKLKRVMNSSQNNINTAQQI